MLNLAAAAAIWMLLSVVLADRIDIDISSTTAMGAAPIASDFASFSFETNRALALLVFPAGSDAARPSLTNLMQLLSDAAGGSRGPNVRVGGSSADASAFLPADQPLPAGDTYRISDADIAAYRVALPKWNGTLTATLNFRNPSSPALALSHLKALLSLDSAHLLRAVEIGNEVRCAQERTQNLLSHVTRLVICCFCFCAQPDLYFANGVRNLFYNFSVYAEEYSDYAVACGLSTRCSLMQPSG